MTDYKLGGTSLTQLTEALADDDRFLVLNKSDTTTAPADADGSDQWIDGITAARAFLKKGIYLVAPTGETDGTGDTPLINAVTQAGFTAALVPGALYYISNLTAETFGGIYGNNATLLMVSGSTGYALALKTPASTKQVIYQDFTIQINGAAGAGVLVDNTGFEPEIQWVPFDPLHQLRNVTVLGAVGDAFHLDNDVRSVRIDGCVQYHASGYGFFFGNGADTSGIGATDNHVSNCISGKSGLDGFHFEAASGNNGIVNCKAFFAGWSEATGEWTSTTAVGLYNAGNWNRIVGFSGQQNANHGLTLDGCTGVTVTGGEFDTNSAAVDDEDVRTQTDGCGINLTGTIDHCTVVGNTGSNNLGDPPGAQAYGIQLDCTLTSSQVTGNAIGAVNDGINETVDFANGGGNVIVDISQAVFGSTAFLQGNPGAFVQGQTSAPAASQFFAGFWTSDPTGEGFGNLASITGAGLAGLLQQSQPSPASPVTVGNTTTITSLGSMTVPANDPVAGARYKVTGHGTLTTEATPGVMTVDLRWGGTGGTLIVSLVTSTSAPTAPVSLTAVPVLIEGEIEFLTSTTVIGWLRLTYRPAATTAAVVWLNSITTAVTVTTSSAKAFSLDWKWATANASNTVTIESSFERVA